MGCDIHLVLEQRDGDKWVGVDTFVSHNRAYAKDEMDAYSSPIARQRNYNRFAALAGVRGKGPAARGIPDNASDTARFLVKSWASDGHSHSWLPMKEAAQIWLNTGYHDLKDAADFIKKYPECHYFNVDCSEGSGKSADDFRVVFWFDN
jgi:hypothetical protein